MLDAYRWTLEELDKTASPTLEVDSFVYQFNSTLDEYLSNQLPGADITQKESDDIDSFIVHRESLKQDSTDKSVFEIPEDYRHTWVVEVKAKWTAAFGKFSKDEQVTLYTRRRRASRKGYQEANAFQKPSYFYPLHERRGENLVIMLGSYLEPVSCYFTYVKSFDELMLSADGSQNSEIGLPVYVIREVTKVLARKLLEELESRRYASQLQETKLRNE